MIVPVMTCASRQKKTRVMELAKGAGLAHRLDVRIGGTCQMPGQHMCTARSSFSGNSFGCVEMHCPAHH